jgi:hypothetical protein
MPRPAQPVHSRPGGSAAPPNAERSCRRYPPHKAASRRRRITSPIHVLLHESGTAVLQLVPAGGSGSSPPLAEGSGLHVPLAEGSGLHVPLAEGSGLHVPLAEGSGPSPPAAKQPSRCRRRRSTQRSPQRSTASVSPSASTTVQPGSVEATPSGSCLFALSRECASGPEVAAAELPCSHPRQHQFHVKQRGGLGQPAPCRAAGRNLLGDVLMTPGRNDAAPSAAPSPHPHSRARTSATPSRRRSRRDWATRPRAASGPDAHSGFRDWHDRRSPRSTARPHPRRGGCEFSSLD